MIRRERPAITLGQASSCVCHDLSVGELSLVVARNTRLIHRRQRPVLSYTPPMSETGQIRHDVRTAASRLGITPDGVRKQIHRGKLPAEKIGSQWFVLLPADNPETEHGLETGQDKHDTGQRTPSPAATEASRRYLQELRDEWLLPLIRENGELRERIGRLEERLSSVERERDEARAQLKPIVLTSPPTSHPTTTDSNGAPPPWWAFLASLRSSSSNVKIMSNGRGPSRAMWRTCLPVVWHGNLEPPNSPSRYFPGVAAHRFPS